MVKNRMVAALCSVIVCSTVVWSAPAELKLTKGRIVISHDGNNYDKDDAYSMAMNWAVMSAFGCQQRFVHLHHSVMKDCDDPLFHAQMTKSAEGWKYFPGFDSSIVFDAWVDIDKTVAHFKVQAEKGAPDDKLYFLLAGSPHVAYLCITATAKEKRTFIHCVSHHSGSEPLKSCVSGGKTWSDIKITYSSDGVICESIKDQNANLGGVGHTKWSFLDFGMEVKEEIPLSAWKWLWSRDWKGNGDCSDNGMMWYVLTGNMNATYIDYEERFKNPLPMEGTTGIASPSARTTSFTGTPLEVSLSQKNKVLDVTINGMKGNGSVAVYNLQSRLVGKGALMNGKAQVSLNRGTRGSYVMTAESQGQKISKQLFLK